MKRWLLRVVPVIVAGVSVTAAFAQGQRFVEEQKRQSLATTEQFLPQGYQRFLWDYGVWTNYRYSFYRNDDNNKNAPDLLRQAYSLDTRVWLKMVLRSPLDSPRPYEHLLYLRFKNLYIDRAPQGGNGNFDDEGPTLDYAYVYLDLKPVSVLAGQRYFSIGRGIAYDDLNDGVQLLWFPGDWYVQAMTAHTLPREDNADLSVPGSDKSSDRWFAGTEIGYRGFKGHKLYGFVLTQNDFSDASPVDTGHHYTYNSQYYGLGAEGQIAAVTNYWVEATRETGRSYIYTTDTRAGIDAWALDCGITQHVPVYGRPDVTFEYAFGSGDADRTSVTDTIGGNLQGKDENFLSFGYLLTGYALAPNLSNLHMYKLGLNWYPLEKTRSFKKVSVGIDYYRFFKNKREGGISDADATQNSADIGQEIDAKLTWPVLSDVTIGLYFGHFMPGAAYADGANAPKNYFSTVLTFTF